MRSKKILQIDLYEAYCFNKLLPYRFCTSSLANFRNSSLKTKNRMSLNVGTNQVSKACVRSFLADASWTHHPSWVWLILRLAVKSATELKSIIFKTTWTLLQASKYVLCNQNTSSARWPLDSPYSPFSRWAFVVVESRQGQDHKFCTEFCSFITTLSEKSSQGDHDLLEPVRQQISEG